MTTSNVPTFAHRYCDSREVESICMECFTTVCSCAGIERALEAEAKHICRPTYETFATLRATVMRLHPN